MSLIVPLNLLREADEDVVVDGYNIPKGTAIAVEISVIMSDPKNFEEPKRFKPERYLGNNLESKVLAFGIGKRACLGEALARTELYLVCFYNKYKTVHLDYGKLPSHLQSFTQCYFPCKY